MARTWRRLRSALTRQAAAAQLRSTGSAMGCRNSGHAGLPKQRSTPTGPDRRQLAEQTNAPPRSPFLVPRLPLLLSPSAAVTGPARFGEREPQQALITDAVAGQRAAASGSPRAIGSVLPAARSSCPSAEARLSASVCLSFSGAVSSHCDCPTRHPLCLCFEPGALAPPPNACPAVVQSWWSDRTVDAMRCDAIAATERWRETLQAASRSPSSIGRTAIVDWMTLSFDLARVIRGQRRRSGTRKVCQTGSSPGGGQPAPRLNLSLPT